MLGIYLQNTCKVRLAYHRLVVYDVSIMKLEKWKPIEGYSDYLASSFGRIMRVVATVPSGSAAGKILKQGTLKHGYKNVSLYKLGVPKSLSVHRVIATAFFGKPKLDLVVNHKDGNKKNNNINNLEFVTATANELHALLSGLKAHGDRHGSAKLRSADIPVILARINAGHKTDSMAADYGVTTTTIRNVANNKTWRCIPRWVAK